MAALHAQPAPAPADAWPALVQARQADLAARWPFEVLHQGQCLRVGSVARLHLAALQALAPAGSLLMDEGRVLLRVPADERNALLDQLHRRLQAEGLIRAWRDEPYGLHVLPPRGAAPGGPPGPVLAVIERAAARFWGSLTFGAHANGYVADAEGRPQALWIARRSATKATDPGLLDNLVGGGVPHGQSPAEAVVREGWEEAGLQPAQMQGLRSGRRLVVARDLPEGFQLEWLSVFDLALPDGLQPCNQDGEVQALYRMPVAEALVCAASGQMTVDAALATLDFGLRHQLLPPAQAQALALRLAELEG